MFKRHLFKSANDTFGEKPCCASPPRLPWPPPRQGRALRTGALHAAGPAGGEPGSPRWDQHAAPPGSSSSRTPKPLVRRPSGPQPPCPRDRGSAGGPSPFLLWGSAEAGPGRCGLASLSTPGPTSRVSGRVGATGRGSSAASQLIFPRCVPAARRPDCRPPSSPSPADDLLALWPRLPPRTQKHLQTRLCPPHCHVPRTPSRFPLSPAPGAQPLTPSLQGAGGCWAQTQSGGPVRRPSAVPSEPVPPQTGRHGRSLCLTKSSACGRLWQLGSPSLQSVSSLQTRASRKAKMGCLMKILCSYFIRYRKRHF